MDHKFKKKSKSGSESLVADIQHRSGTSDSAPPKFGSHAVFPKELHSYRSWPRASYAHGLLKPLADHHFVERNQEELIKCVSRVPEVLNGLMDVALKEAEYEAIMSEPTDVLKMQKLYELVPNWNTKCKEHLYLVLQKTNGPLVAKLEGGHFVERNQEELIKCVSRVPEVLNGLMMDVALKEAEYEAIMSEPTDVLKMQELYELVPYWNMKCKDHLYLVLQKTNGPLVAKLEGGHFVERNQEELIKCVSRVPEVLNGLMDVALKEAEYEAIMSEPTDVLKMQELYELVPYWNMKCKDHLYLVLQKTNGPLVAKLEGGHFVERNQEELIRCTSSVLYILRRLIGVALNVVEYKAIMSESTDLLKMQKLYELVPNWNVRCKDHLYLVLQKTNGPLVAKLSEGHFVERNQDELIRRVSRVPEVLDGLVGVALNDAQYQAIMSEPRDAWRMEKLYELVPKWNMKCKNHLYQVLQKTNQSLIAKLEDGHFVERNQEELIRCVSNVPEVLNGLMDVALNKYQYKAIISKHTNFRRMKKLYKLLPSWNMKCKNHFYRVLQKTNGPLIAKLEEQGSDWSYAHLNISDSFTDVISSSLSDIDPDTKSWFFYTSQKPSAVVRSTWKTETPTDPWEGVICDQCSCEEKPTEKIVPNIDWNSQRSHETYSLATTEAGILHCFYTDLIFEVTGAVTITYCVDSWYEHLDLEESREFIIAGTLFNIQADPGEAVAAAHFPHFLCLAGEDHSEVQIAHFSEGEMSLDNPDVVGPFHAVLKNPTFSPRGVLKSISKRKAKVHAMALLYHLEALGSFAHTFHLYLLPNNPCLKKVVEEREQNYHSRRIPKPPGIRRPLRIGSFFFVQRSDDIAVLPKDYMFEYLDPDMEQQYFEVYAERMKEKMELSLMEKQDKVEDPVWETCVRQDELMRSAPPPPVVEASPELHFIERHREKLIQRTGCVRPVLDKLIGHGILNDEQYQKVLSEKTNPSQMRELFLLLPSWNCSCKNKFYEALKSKNPYLIDELEGR